MHLGRVAFDPNTSAAAHLLVGHSDRRQRLTIFPPSSGNATISNETTVAAGQGIFLQSGAAPIYLDVDFHGDCVQREWYIIYGGSGSGCAFIETLCYGEHNHAHDSEASVRN